MGWLFLAITVVALVILDKKRQADAKAFAASIAAAKKTAQQQEDALRATIASQAGELEGLRRFEGIRDAAAEAERLTQEASEAVRKAQAEADGLRQRAQREADQLKAAAEAEADGLRRDARTASTTAKLNATAVEAEAHARAKTVMSTAEARAQEIAGDALRALREADQLKAAVTAMQNLVDGYGDRYLVPTYSVLDQLAADYGFEQTGQELTRARQLTKSLVTAGRAAACEYAEARRRSIALRFVLDAFNGKVDTILTRVNSDNVGTLEQQIRDAFAIVNEHGAAFRNAAITPAYLDARLSELKWAAAIVALKDRDKEEQRRAREQIREEERARREIERALRDAAKEEETLQRAMEKARRQVEAATAEERAAFEAQLEALQSKLAEAEARNQRALSMAQQTKAGHVYVISNVGSFGENVLKVGMTRRLEPLDRIRELGDASVPFGFDVHAMIWSEDAPALEHALHKQFVKTQVNKVNPRKEFFRIPVGDVRACVEDMGLNAIWTLKAEAAQFRETLAIEEALAKDSPQAADWLRTQLAWETPTSEQDYEEEAASLAGD